MKQPFVNSVKTAGQRTPAATRFTVDDTPSDQPLLPGAIAAPILPASQEESFRTFLKNHFARTEAPLSLARDIRSMMENLPD